MCLSVHLVLFVCLSSVKVSILREIRGGACKDTGWMVERVQMKMEGCSNDLGRISIEFNCDQQAKAARLACVTVQQQSRDQAPRPRKSRPTSGCATSSLGIDLEGTAGKHHFGPPALFSRCTNRIPASLGLLRWAEMLK